MNPSQKAQLNEINTQYALIGASQSRINEIDAAIEANQAIIDSETLVDSVSPLAKERQDALVAEALGIDKKTELSRLELAIVAAQKSDTKANQQTLDLTAKAIETIAGLKALKASESDKLDSLQAVCKEMRKTYLLLLTEAAGERYLSAAKEAINALLDILAADAVYEQETGQIATGSKWATGTIRGEFYLALPTLTGGEFIRELISGNRACLVECDRSQAYTSPDRKQRSNAIIATLTGGN